MTEHKLTIGRLPGAIQEAARCSCGGWTRPVPGNPDFARRRAQRAHVEHIQTEADWDAIAWCVDHSKGWFIGSDPIGQRAVEALARLRGRP